MGDFRVMLDYSHNSAGYNEIMKFVQKMNVKRPVGVIGMPGDRQNRNIYEVGQLCSKVFSRIYIKEDNDLRGRKPGEVAEILYKAAIDGGSRKEEVEIIYSELKALEKAILDAQPGDLIVMLYEEFEPAVELITKLKQELEQSTIDTELIMEESAG
jgi:cyanophycin synthetase